MLLATDGGSRDRSITDFARRLAVKKKHNINTCQVVRVSFVRWRFSQINIFLNYILIALV